MTTTIKSHKNDNYYITLELDKSNIYTVQACPKINDNLYGYPKREMTYPINEKNKALATYNRYIKKYI